jgi:hypothetical protein
LTSKRFAICHLPNIPDTPLSEEVKIYFDRGPSLTFTDGETYVEELSKTSGGTHTQRFKSHAEVLDTTIILK